MAERDSNDRSSLQIVFNSAVLRWLDELAEQGVLTTDKDLQILTWNKWLEIRSGRTATEVVGRHLFEVYPQLVERKLEKYYQDALAGHPRVLAHSFHRYLLPLRSEISGNDFAEMLQSTRIVPLLDNDRVVGTITVIEDVTERVAREAELRHQIGALESLQQALRQSQEWFSTTLHSIGDAVIAVNLEGQIVSINAVAQSLTGWSEQEAKGQRLEDVFQIINEDTRERASSPIDKVLRAGVVSGLANHTLLVAKDGTERPIDDSAAPIKDDQGKLFGIVLIFRDITERRRTEDEREQSLAREQKARTEAEAASRLKDEFLATVSHELRTPLNAMMGWVHILRRGNLDKMASEQALETIIRNARMQNKLIEDLLDVSRIITGKLRLEIRPIDLIAVIEAAIEVVRPSAEAKGIQLHTQLNPLSAPTLSDPNRMQQIIWNLTSNAIKFTPSGGRVTIKLERIQSQVEIAISDTGQGISPEFLPHVFERFRQADATSTRKHAGLGLGLAIVRHLVELHGGNVQAHSDGEGKGATFTVRIPVNAALKQGSEEAVRSTLVDSGVIENQTLLKDLRILVVDDEEDARSLVTAVLEKYGAVVEVVGSTAEALLALQERMPDVIVSDIGMPDEDGYTLIRKVRAQQSGHKIPAVALTAYARVEDRIRALEAGFQSHVPKPIEPDELVLVISSMIGQVRNNPPG
jgi:PAS domain S-box-containing protein